MVGGFRERSGMECILSHTGRNSLELDPKYIENDERANKELYIAKFYERRVCLDPSSKSQIKLTTRTLSYSILPPTPR